MCRVSVCVCILEYCVYDVYQYIQYKIFLINSKARCIHTGSFFFYLNIIILNVVNLIVLVDGKYHSINQYE